MRASVFLDNLSTLGALARSWASNNKNNFGFAVSILASGSNLGFFTVAQHFIDLDNCRGKYFFNGLFGIDSEDIFVGGIHLCDHWDGLIFVGSQSFFDSFFVVIGTALVSP